MKHNFISTLLINYTVDSQKYIFILRYKTHIVPSKMERVHSERCSFSKGSVNWKISPNGTLVFTPYLGYVGYQNNIPQFQQQHEHLVLQLGHLVSALLYQLLLQKMGLHLTMKKYMYVKDLLDKDVLVNFCTES